MKRNSKKESKYKSLLESTKNNPGPLTLAALRKFLNSFPPPDAPTHYYDYSGKYEISKHVSPLSD